MVQAQITLGANELPIHDAARLGKAAEVERILKADPAMRDARNPMGATPLHLAATNPDIGPLKALLAAGADARARDKEDLTPLHMAAYTDKPEHARLLLEAGADVDANRPADARRCRWRARPAPTRPPASFRYGC